MRSHRRDINALRQAAAGLLTELAPATMLSELAGPVFKVTERSRRAVARR